MRAGHPQWTEEGFGRLEVRGFWPTRSPRLLADSKFTAFGLLEVRVPSLLSPKQARVNFLMEQLIFS